MTQRSAHIVAYDIRDPKRLRKVHKTLCDHGDPLQFSVFRCALNAMERRILISELRAIIHHREDRVLLADLGPLDGRGGRAIEVIGNQDVPSDPGPTVI